MSAQSGAQPFRLEEATIEALHAAITSGRTTCVAVVQHYIDRVRAYNGVASALVTTDGASIPEAPGAVRAAISFLLANNAFDVRHDLMPLSAFPPAPPKFWQAYGAGTPLSLTQLGITAPNDWEICAAVAHRRP